MVDDILTWNGISSDSFSSGNIENPVFIKKIPTFDYPIHQGKTYQIHGRSGEVVMQDSDLWNNYDKVYELFLMPNLSSRSVLSLSRSVANWICGPTGYRKLKESAEPNHFRLAYVKQAISIQNHLQHFGTARVVFSCRPELYTEEGDIDTEYNRTQGEAGITIHNGSGHKARPFFTLIPYGAPGTGTNPRTEKTAVFRVNNWIVQISEMPPGPLYIDCDSMDIYSGKAINRNNKVVIMNYETGLLTHQFPYFKTGDNLIQWSGDIYHVKVTPRWWVV